MAFVRRKCEEWLNHGLPKLAQLQNHQYPIDESDLKIEKEWQPLLNDQARTVSNEIVPELLSFGDFPFDIYLHSIYLTVCGV